MSAPSQPTSPRRVPLSGCHNFRDLGGITTSLGRVVPGLVFRSDALWDLPEQDVALLRDELGVRELLDLRSSAEHHGSHVGALAEAPVTLHHLPLFDDDTTRREATSEVLALPLSEKYALLSQIGGEAIARGLTLIAKAEAPAVFFCSAGKDRTGILAAVILSLLGASRAQIVEDYVASARNLEAVHTRLRTMRGIESMLAVIPESDLLAEPETMHAFLDYLESEAGGGEAYALSIGVEEPVLRALRGRLVDG